MDFYELIVAHTQWKNRLTTYAVKPDDTLSIHQIASPDQCELGRWLAGEGMQYSGLPEYTSLVASHVRFHQAAAEIFGKADSGHAVAQEISPEANSNFTAASNEIVQALKVMMKKVLTTQ